MTDATAAPPQRNLPARLIMVLVILFLVGLQVWYAQRLGYGPSRIADAFSEANSLRAGACYAEQGFLKYIGLPDIAYGEQFPNTGAKSQAGDDGTFVYTHYPPGPDLILGAATLLFGQGNVVLFRMFPIAVGLVALSLFAWGLSRSLGDAKAAALLVGCAIVPAFSNMMHGLHHQGYALSLLLIQLGVLMMMFKSDRPAGRWWYCALFALGFFQGWLKFDYCFVVTFAPVPLAILRSAEPNWIKRGLACVFVLGLSFTLAHLLHFFQVAVYFGSVSEAVRDLTESARIRARGATPLEVDTTPVALLVAYLIYPIHHWRFFGWFFRLAAALAAAAIITGRGRTILDNPVPIVIQWDLASWKTLLAVFTALLISSLWILIMWNHSWHHRHYIPRIFFLSYFIFLLVVIEATTVRRSVE